MRCPSCGFDHAEGMAFCTECGAWLTNRCPSCGFDTVDLKAARTLLKELA